MTCKLWEATAAELRQWAGDFTRQIEAATSAEERKRLRKARRALLDLADNEDWLAGRRHQERGCQTAVQDAPENVSA